MEAEHEVLGSMLVDPACIDDVVTVLGSADLASPANALLFRVFSGLRERGEPIEAASVHQVLKLNGNAEFFGRPVIPYLANLVDKYGSTSNVLHYARLVREASVRRAICTAGREAIMLAHETDRPLDDVRSMVDTAIREAVGSHVNDNHLGMAGDGASKLLGQMETMADAGTSVGEPTGFASIDEAIGGYGDDELIVLAGLTRMGKTSLALQLAGKMADRGRHVLYFSMEMSRKRLQRRLITMKARIEITDLKNPRRIHEDAWPRVHSAVDWMSHLPMHIDDTTGLSMTRLRSVSRSIKQRHPLGLVVVDYLQLMSLEQAKGQTKADALGVVTRALKVLASDEIGCPVLLLAQMNRGFDWDNKGKKVNRFRKPQCSDLKDSSTIEQDADVVAFITERDVKGDQDHTRELWLAKVRDGASNVGVPLKWRPLWMRFEE